MKLRTAKTGDFVNLKGYWRDNISTPDFWFLVDTERDVVTLTHQRSGKAAKTQITIPRKVFNKFVDFYEREQPKPKGQRKP